MLLVWYTPSARAGWGKQCPNDAAPAVRPTRASPSPWGGGIEKDWVLTVELGDTNVTRTLRSKRSIFNRHPQYATGVPAFQNVPGAFDHLTDTRTTHYTILRCQTVRLSKLEYATAHSILLLKETRFGESQWKPYRRP